MHEGRADAFDEVMALLDGRHDTLKISDRNELASAVQLFLQDGDWSEQTSSDAECERMETLLVEPLLKLICQHVGHQVIPDHCRKPEHDYCNRCRETRPGEAVRP